MDNEIEHQLRELGNTKFPVDDLKRVYIVPVLRARTTGRLGLLLLLFPLAFLLGVLLEMYLNVHDSVFSMPYNWVTSVAPDSDASIISWLIRFLLVGAPILVLGLNLLAVTGVWYNKQGNELLLSLKLKWFNGLLIVLSGLIVLSFAIYGIAENM